MLTVVDRPGKPKAYVNDASKTSGTTKIERILVTPEIAEAWLSKNLGNRKIRRRRVTVFARDMSNGAWQFTGEAIRFNNDGRLIDGQHRLLACVAAARPFETLIVYGLDPSAQTVIDTGASRSVADTLAMDGYHTSGALATAGRLLLMEKQGQSDFNGASSYSKTEIMKAIAKHRELPSVVNDIASHRLPKGLNAAQIATVVYVGKYLLGVPKVADAFRDVLVSGVPSYNGDAAHLYRERILRDIGSGESTIKRSQRWRLIKHTWNLFTLGEPVRHLKTPSAPKFEGLDYKLL